MDPMSAAASIIGLLGAAAKVSEVLLKFIGNVKGAPKLAKNVLMEIDDVSACLNQLQRYLQGALSISSSQEQLLMVEQLVVTLSNCVLIFSELEETVQSLKPVEPMQPWRLAQWLFKEQAISALLIRMQQSKLSLSLMLTILTCSSIGEAQTSANQLTALITQVLESNLEMSQRMANLEMRTLGDSQSSAPNLANFDVTMDDDSIITMRAANDTDEGGTASSEDIKMTGETNQDTSKEPARVQRPSFGFTFDQDLHNSRPYTRAKKRSSVWSTNSSTVHTTGWSCLSGLSLTDVSEISVIGLPISPDELWNGHHYIFTDCDGGNVSEKTRAPVMDDSAYRDDNIFSENDSGSTEIRKAIHLFNRAQSTDGSLDLSPSHRQGRKVPVTAGGRLIESKKIVLLGASMAGKTTIYHRLQMTHGNGFTDSERRRARASVIHGLVEVFKKARRQCRNTLPIEDIEHFETLAYATRDQTLSGIWTLRCYRALIALWSNPEIRGTIENGRDAALNETVPYLLENLDFLFYESIMPDEMLLRGCYRTTGIHETILGVDGRSCHIYDVDGRALKRKRWMNQFQHVDAVFFVVSLTGYCQTLPGNLKQNQMLESLLLFESITKVDGFRTTPIVLLMNKFDLLEQRMRENPIVDHYPEYSGDSNPMTACRFLAAKYSELDRRPHGSLRIQVTSAAQHEDFKCSIDEIWPDLFANGLVDIPEAPE